jgi:hypothetical protein
MGVNAKDAFFGFGRATRVHCLVLSLFDERFFVRSVGNCPALFFVFIVATLEEFYVSRYGCSRGIAIKLLYPGCYVLVPDNA